MKNYYEIANGNRIVVRHKETRGWGFNPAIRLTEKDGNILMGIGCYADDEYVEDKRLINLGDSDNLDIDKVFQEIHKSGCINFDALCEFPVHRDENNRLLPIRAPWEKLPKWKTRKGTIMDLFYTNPSYVRNLVNKICLAIE